MREVFRDRWIVVVDKPSGVPTQATAAGERGLYEALRESGEIFLHHRLDQPASGLVLFSCHRAANAGITEGLRQRSIRRRYRAVLYGPAVGGRWTSPVDGKRAATRVAVLGEGSGMSAVGLELESGRKHQIRVQSALAGTPIVGDRRYGGDAGRAWPRLALHAFELSFEHPVTGEPLALQSPIPPDLAELWALAGGPSEG